MGTHPLSGHDILSYLLSQTAAAWRRDRRAAAPKLGSFAMNVETILRNKGNSVATIRPDATVAEAVDILNRKRIGALVVSEDGHGVDGILSERDIVIALAEHAADLLSRPVGEIMTRTVITCGPSDTVGELMAEMTNRRIRHFPVVAEGRLCGIVSIGDLVKNRLDEVEFEASSMRSFIAGA
jgi:CBS domain-containing protein